MFEHELLVDCEQPRQRKIDKNWKGVIYIIYEAEQGSAHAYPEYIRNAVERRG